MTLPLTPTLGQLRNEVLLRCGYSTTGNQAAGVTPVCDSLIAGAEKELFYECEWLNAVKRTEIELTEDVNVVDWPDASAPGEITAVAVVKTNEDATESLFPMAPGARLQERDAAADESGLPVVFESIDEQIYIYPAPSDLYTALVVDYRAQPSLLQATDRTLVDGELLVQRAVFKMKEYLALPIGPKELADHERYLARLRASNSGRGGIQLGGHRSHKTYQRKKNRVASGFLPNNSFDNFHPW